MSEDGPSSLALRDSSLARHRADASKQLEEMEAKELELKRKGEEIVRNQISGLGRELNLAIQEMENFKRVTMEGMKKMQSLINENMTEIEAEKEARKKLDEKMEEKIKILHDELDQEKRDRAAGDEANRQLLKREIQPLIDRIDAKTRDIDTLEKEINKLSNLINSFPQRLDKLNDAIKQEVQDRKAAEDPILDSIRRLRDTLMKEVKEMGDGNGAAIKSLRDAFDKDKTDREMTFNDHENKINEINRDLMPHAKQVPVLKGKLSDLVDTIHPKLKEHKDDLDRHKDGTADLIKKHDQLLSDLLKKIEAESSSRNNMMDELEQMNTGFRTKMRGLINEGMDENKKSIDEVNKRVSDLDSKNRKFDESLERALDQINTNKKNVEINTENIGIVKMDSERCVRKVDELTQKLNDLKNTLQTGLAERKEDTDGLAAALDQHIAGLESLFHDLGERLLNSGVQRRLITWISNKGGGQLTVTAGE